jgi:hypothetical protein
MNILTSYEKTDYTIRETDDQGQVRYFRAASLEQASEQADRLLRCAAAWGRKYEIELLDANGLRFWSAVS